MSISPGPSLRPMTEEERERVVSWIIGDMSQSITCLGAVLTFATIIGIFIGGYMLCEIVIEALQITANITPYTLVGSLVLGVVVAFRLYYTVYGKIGRPPLPESRYSVDLEKGEVAVQQYTIGRAARLPEEENLPPAFFLEVGPNRLLYLDGDDLFEQTAKHRFPCRTLSLARLPHAGDVVSIECHGELLDLSDIPIIESYDPEKLPDNNGDEIDGTFESLTARLRPAPQSPEDTLEGVTLPRQIDPRLRPLMRISIGYYGAIAFLIILGLLPSTFLALDLIGYPNMSWSDKIGLSIWMLVFPVGVSIVIWQLLKAKSSMLDDLRLASKTLNEATPLHVTVQLIYLLTTKPGERPGLDKRYYAELPEDFARKHRLPKMLEILPPVGTVKKAIVKFNWAHTGQSGTFRCMLAFGPADIYLGEADMVVIGMGRDYFVRQIVL
ncbi:MAG: hypothetical protein ACYC6A_23720 [Armatimonadota bacterium]